MLPLVCSCNTISQCISKTTANKAVTDRRLRPRFAIADIIQLPAYGLLLQPRPSRLAAPPGWLALPVLHRHLCIRPIMCKYDVIHKPEVYNISHDDRATDIGNMRENLVKIGRVVPEIRSRTDRQTRQTRSSQYYASLPAAK